MTTVIKNQFELGESVILWKEDVLPDDLHEALLKEFQTLEWHDGDYEGRKVSRKQRWYHTDNAYFCKQWPHFTRWVSNPYFPALEQAQQYVQTYVNTVFNIPTQINSVLINAYENGKAVISKHRDNETIFGDNPTVIILSLGSTRTLRFSRVKPHAQSLKTIGHTIDIDLKPKSILIMQGTTQKYYCHELLVSDSDKPRYSMTFRRHVPTIHTPCVENPAVPALPIPPHIALPAAS
jgi:alkylated DNA repair dioxygenase AlkB